MNQNDPKPTAVRGTNGRDREHLRPRRHRALSLRYTEDEYRLVQTAAQEAGLTPTGYVAAVAVAVAQGREAPHREPWRLALLELMEARRQVRRIGVNLNQAARAINATGEPPPWLEHVAALTARAITTVDDAARALATERR